jgi:hypothetical protein
MRVLPLQELDVAAHKCGCTTNLVGAGLRVERAERRVEFTPCRDAGCLVCRSWLDGTLDAEVVASRERALGIVASLGRL